ncbi:MAG: hypothetical protein GC185_08920 [Alphaproteobacteria bacterium]|nr:hypothetical protein [Alphaproteobacteria bacterium]
MKHIAPKTMPKTALTLAVLVAALVAGVPAYAQKAASEKDAATLVVARSTHAQHIWADLVSARIRAGLRGQSEETSQDCGDGRACGISIKR